MDILGKHCIRRNKLAVSPGLRLNSLLFNVSLNYPHLYVIGFTDKVSVP